MSAWLVALVFAAPSQIAFREPYRLATADGAIVAEGGAAPLLADFNADGKLDLWLGQGQGRVQVFLNEGDARQPVFKASTPLKAGGSVAVVREGFAPQVGDLNDDGQLDLVTGTASGEILLFAGTAPGEFAKPTPLMLADEVKLNPGPHSAVCLADWDRDGDLDLLTGTEDGPIQFYANESAGESYVFKEGVALRVGDEPLHARKGAPTVADWDADGALDLIVGDADGLVTFYRTAGFDDLPLLSEGDELLELVPDADKPLKSAEGVKRSRGRARPAVADLNGDGKMDLLVGDSCVLADGKTSPEQAQIAKRLGEIHASATSAAFKQLKLTPSKLSAAQKAKHAQTVNGILAKNEEWQRLTKRQVALKGGVPVGWVWVWIRR